MVLVPLQQQGPHSTRQRPSPTRRLRPCHRPPLAGRGLDPRARLFGHGRPLVVAAGWLGGVAGGPAARAGVFRRPAGRCARRGLPLGGTRGAVVRTFHDLAQLGQGDLFQLPDSLARYAKPGAQHLHRFARGAGHNDFSFASGQSGRASASRLRRCLASSASSSNSSGLGCIMPQCGQHTFRRRHPAAARRVAQGWCCLCCCWNAR